MNYESEAAKDVIRDCYKRSLYYTCTHLLGYRDFSFKTHQPITRLLQSDSQRKLIVVPRGCFKSTIASVSYPIWLLMKDPNIRIMIDSELMTNSTRFLREIKGHLKSQHMIELFGEFEGSVWNDSEIIIKQRTKNLKESSITCSGIGAQKTSAHFDIIIADDLNSPDNSQTEDAREKVIEHYKYYISLLEPNGTLVLIGTRYSYSDVIGFVLDNEINPRGLLT